MTYWAMNVVFLGVVAVVGVIALVRGRADRIGSAYPPGGSDRHPDDDRRPVRARALLTALMVLLALTAVFDNVMIGIGLVGYDASRISGAFVGIAPLEDFAYTVAAAVLLPSLWVLLGRAPRGAARRRTGAR